MGQVRTLREGATPQSGRPAVLSWIPVLGPDGRVRMEMLWQVGERRTDASQAAPATAAVA
ncbi:MAG: hypothetical protein H0U62_13605 [Actinobacteria bacterium]|nr:hypothetical protein [Actinomycetota bacterium]